MSNLTSVERVKIEKLLTMDFGYVLDFSNSSFERFFLENTGIEIYNDKYSSHGSSKANRLRAFWKIEPNYVVGNLLMMMVDYGIAKNLIPYDSNSKVLLEECKKICERLLQDTPVENIDALKISTDDKDFKLLAKHIKESIVRNEPEVAIDRLHTYVIKYFRELCEKHGISYNKETPLHTLFGGYIKHISSHKIIESEMTERILKSSISVLDAFNYVRNNQSFAHDNPILNYNEAILIFNNISSLIRFVNSIERPSAELNSKADNNNDDLPF